MKKGQLRISNLILIVFLVTGFFVGAGLFISDFERSYVQTNITEPIGDYDDEELKDIRPSITRLEDATSPVQESFDLLADAEGKGFLQVTGVIITDTIPKIFIAGVQSVPVFIGIIGEMIYSVGERIIPGEQGDTTGGNILIILIMMALIVWGLFKIIESSRRYPV